MNNVIVLINLIKDSSLDKAGKDRALSQGYDISIKSWTKYCQKYNILLYVIDQPIIDDYNILKPHWTKMYILDVLDSNQIEYDQVMYVDSDTIVHANAPNIFDYTDHKFCIVRNYGSMAWVCRSLEVYSKFLFDNHKLSYSKYFNSGMFVFNKTHKAFFTKLQEFYFGNMEKILYIQEQYKLGNDQPVLNFMLDIHIPDDVKILGYEWNMQDMQRIEVLSEDMLHTKYGFISHYNCGVHPSPRSWMQKTYEYLYE